MHQGQNGRISSHVLTLYIFIMFCIYPLYYENGYYDIGTVKCKVFLVVSVVLFLAVSILAIIELMIQKKRIRDVWDWNRFSITEKMLGIYMLILATSYIFSPFQKEVLLGARDWCMGTIPLLLMSGFVFLISGIWEEQKWIGCGCLLVSEVIFLLGICNRFSCYPIAMKPHQAEFISTLGNINWFCGYMSVIAPIGIGFFILMEENNSRHGWIKRLLFIYMLTAFVVGFCQGSSSVFLWEMAMFVILFGIAIQNTDTLKRWFLMLSVWGLSGQMVKVLKESFPEKFNYDTGRFLETNVTLWVALAALFLYLLCHFYDKEDKKISIAFQIRVKCVIAEIIIVILLLWILLSVYNTKIGIWFLQDYPLFLFDENWGNGRGAIFKISFKMFGEMSFIQKIIGVGADGFRAFAYSLPDISIGLREVFGESMLTNAHSEWITNLINTGILGISAYIGVFFSFVARCMKKGKEQPILYIPAVCVICYFANNLMSFAQVLSTPFLFLIMGVGEYYLKKMERN